MFKKRKKSSIAWEQFLIPWRRRARHSLAKIIIIQLISCSLLHLFYTTSNNETGLAEHKDTLGSPLCPCRHYDDKEAEVKAGFWNCPCIPMRERKECHCMLFLTEDNDFAGDDNTITIEEINEAIEDM
jgi:ferredoxin-thioredoxin reductase catalytic chain